MKIQLDYKINIEVREGGKKKDALCVFYREFTKAEKKEYEELVRKFTGMFRKSQKISKKQATLNKKIELFENSNQNEKALECIEKLEELDEELEAIEDEIIEIAGGENENDFAEKSAKERFEIVVSGKDKEKLEQLAEIKGYVEIMSLLDKAKSELEKKQSGE